MSHNIFLAQLLIATWQVFPINTRKQDSLCTHRRKQQWPCGWCLWLGGRGVTALSLRQATCLQAGMATQVGVHELALTCPSQGPTVLPLWRRVSAADALPADRPKKAPWALPGSCCHLRWLSPELAQCLYLPHEDSSKGNATTYQRWHFQRTPGCPS